MSNFICPHCQQVIDDGSDGFTSDREIELEKKILEIEENTWDYDLMTDRISELLQENKRLKKKLEIAVKALEEVIKENEGCMDCTASLPAEKALEKIKEIK